MLIFNLKLYVYCTKYAHKEIRHSKHQNRINPTAAEALIQHEIWPTKDYITQNLQFIKQNDIRGGRLPRSDIYDGTLLLL